MREAYEQTQSADKWLPTLNKNKVSIKQPLHASWENSGQKIQAAMDKVLGCEVALMNYYRLYGHPDLQGSKNSFYHVSMCVPSEGTTPEKIGKAHTQRSKAAEEANARIHMALMFPGMGTRALPEGYGRVTTWADMEALATSGNWPNLF